ncbi:hypothetical protein F9C07_10324 [Aspergillus flavus]|uniref:Uncharacterized protein n=1 Tax=Aspergillus flavus (strain ATCC 200026 / FGSC A1120 / IAM 13836 / NRRL 3357 / JCM 12722 / SRRC 167) TaxID=332952 RepID=A0A7U2MVY4_ASPFN|nr:hypothetical protein AFLA70_3g008081 [Aspergillus flavus AF70]QRD90872.1 hypothetical protein F9C07_10324 [Aspergillus flavus]
MSQTYRCICATFLEATFRLDFEYSIYLICDGRIPEFNIEMKWGSLLLRGISGLHERIPGLNSEYARSRTFKTT